VLRSNTTKTTIRRSVAGALCGAALLAPNAFSAPPPAAPPNDNYLASFSMLGAAGESADTYRDVQDTGGGTVQPDLLQPDRDGRPLGGGPQESTQCGPTSYGRTVWYDFSPPYAGAARIVATGFDTAIAVYEYDPHTARILQQVACQDTDHGIVEELRTTTKFLPGHAYTVQVGGVASGGEPASGQLDFTFQFLRDTDSDGIPDAAPDACPNLAGVPPFGCPPELVAQPRYTWAPAPGGIRLKTLVVSGLPSGARVEARCRRCGLRQVVQVRPGTHEARLAGLVGRRLPVGSALELAVTHPPTPDGPFKYGAIGNAFRFPVRPDGLGSRVDRCLLPGSSTPRRSCR
jgi:hypothetical protein